MLASPSFVANFQFIAILTRFMLRLLWRWRLGEAATATSWHLCLLIPLSVCGSSAGADCRVSGEIVRGEIGEESGDVYHPDAYCMRDYAPALVGPPGSEIFQGDLLRLPERLIWRGEEETSTEVTHFRCGDFGYQKWFLLQYIFHFLVHE